ncbi:MAG: helix-turn-helix domain-containing protein [Candidatus Kerfeldbacteria bacterium]|nr:helix-turn-helix domain-containing protein [Candidatus Kerfeldbacteria bacterium]
MLEDQLSILGLSKNEIQVYIALIEKGQSKAGELIRETGLHRHIVYQALDVLAQKRLLTKSTTGTVSLFQATDPLHFLDGIREQELTAQRVIVELRKKKKIQEHEITIYEGDAGMRAYNLKNAENLKPGQYIYVIGSGGSRLQKSIGDEAIQKYFSLIKKNGGIKVLMYQDQQYTEQMFQLIRECPTFEYRVLPFNATPAAGVIFTDKSVAFVMYEDTPTVIEVANTHLVAAYKNYFDMLWHQDVFIEYGADAVKRAFRSVIADLNPGDSYYSIGSLSVDGEVEYAEFFADFHKERIRKSVECFLVAYKEDVEIIRRRFHEGGDPEERLSHIRPLLHSATGFVQVLLYNNTVTLPIYGEKPMVIIIQNASLYTGFKQYFDELWDPHMITLEGVDGIEELCSFVLREGKELALIAANGAIMQSHPQYYVQFTQQRIARDIKMNILANESMRGSAFAQLPLSRVRYLPKEFESPMVIWVFGEYVAHVLWQEPQKIFITHDTIVAQSYRQYFTVLDAIASE